MKLTILHNVSAQLTGQAGVILIQIFYVVVAARLLDIESFGIFSFAFGLVQMVLIFADLGLNLVIVRRISSSPATSPATFGGIFFLKSTLSVLVGGLLAWGGFLLLDDAATAAVLALFSLGMVIHSISLSFNMAFQGHGRLYISSLMSFLLALLQLLFGTGFLLAGGGVLSLAGAYLLSAGTVLLLNFLVYTRKIHSVVPSFDRTQWLPLLREALPLGLGAAFSSAANRVDLPLLLYFSGATEVAIYSAAYRITGALNNVPVAVFAAVLPFFARESWQSRGMNDLLERTLLVSVAAAATLLLFFFIGGPDILVWLFGAGYRQSGALLRILIWAVIPAFLNMAFLHASASQTYTARVYSIAAGAGALANVVLNLWWIPVLGAHGAARATVATEVVVLAVYGLSLHTQIKTATLARAARALALGLAVAAVAFFLALKGLALAMAASALYVLLLLRTGSFTREDWKFWRRQATAGIS